ncbi:EAL domain-containing protein [Cohnella sp. JJ-181]|uniref:EAL domain-containing protein n=1 Tax=Cohnella rhizoplanae TaxID=2974897 RepID=UPI0022FF54BE|nr:EAL domain-containing protein [Cohnella sp. JJ-181]CAI6079875.1 hypothetical protein COHCIP112018_02843 [Cohnella sp. JJ-181]
MDVSAMNEAAAMLPPIRQFERNAKMLFERYDDIAWWMDVNGMMLGGNGAFRNFFGSAALESAGFCWERMIARRDVRRIARRLLEAAVTGREQRLEAHCLHRDGREVRRRIALVPVYAEDTLVGLYGMAALGPQADETDAADKAEGQAASSAPVREQAETRSPLIRELGLAIERNQLIANYQPQLDIRTGRILGVEALLRWHHPERGIVSPCEFIPLAEESGLIMPIGEWVLRTACLQNKTWQNDGMEPLVVSVNLSPRQFEQDDIVETVRRALEDTGLDPRYLELEITEGMTMDVERSIATLRELKKLGVRISVDDFGIGYSSLTYLKRFPIDTLKIDQSFIRECTADENDAMIIKTIISMAHHLNMNVIAEGVEKPEQLIFLQQHLCDEAQGYLFSRPLPAEAFRQAYGQINKMVASLGIKAEMTDRMWMQEQLRATRLDLETTLRKQRGLTMKFNKVDGKFIHTLSDGELLYRMGFSPEQINGKELRDFLPPATAERIEAFYRQAWLGDDHVSYEAEISGICFLSSLRPIRRGGIVVEVIGSAIDITERKRAEETLRQVYARYQLIAENTTDLIAVFDPAGILQYASPSHAPVLGFAMETFEGKLLTDLLHPDDRLHAMAFFSGMLEKKEPSHSEFRLRHRDGGYLWVESGCTPVLGGDGKVERIISVGRDIRLRKQGDGNDGRI